MHFILVAILTAFLFASPAPGVGHAKLYCISQSGRTLFEAEFEGFTTLEKAKLTIDKNSMPFFYSDKCYVTFDSEVNVYTLSVESEDNGNFDTVRYVKFWAVPSSFHEVSSQGTEFRNIYKFNAKLKAIDPRKGKGFETRIILLSCTLTYTNP